MERVVANPNNFVAQLKLGAAFIRVQEFEGAAEAFERASSLEPNDPTAHHALGQTMHQLGKLPEAEASLEKAISLKADKACEAALAAVRKESRLNVSENFGRVHATAGAIKTLQLLRARSELGQVCTSRIPALPQVT